MWQVMVSHQTSLQLSPLRLPKRRCGIGLFYAIHLIQQLEPSRLWFSSSFSQTVRSTFVVSNFVVPQLWLMSFMHNKREMSILAVLQLISDIPEAGLRYQRVPAGTTSTREPVQSSTDHKERTRQQEQSRNEVIWWSPCESSVLSMERITVTCFLQMKVDSQMLNPVSQVIVEIRENTEQLADKIK